MFRVRVGGTGRRPFNMYIYIHAYIYIYILTTNYEISRSVDSNRELLLTCLQYLLLETACACQGLKRAQAVWITHTSARIRNYHSSKNALGVVSNKSFDKRTLKLCGNENDLHDEDKAILAFPNHLPLQ